MDKEIMYFNQCDPRWGGEDYSARGEKTTICESGCAPTAMAMAITALKGKIVLPPELAKWSLKNGYKAYRQGTYYAFFKACGAVYGVRAEQLNYRNLRKYNDEKVHQRAIDCLSKGALLICCMGRGLWTRSGHFILVYGIWGGEVFIKDPASRAWSRSLGEYLRFKREIKYYFSISC